MAVTKVNELTNIGTIAEGDKLVGERVDGTTVRISYDVDITSDAAPVLGASLNMGGFHIIDQNSNGLITFSPQASAVNNLVVQNAIAGAPIALLATGASADVGIQLNTKAAGTYAFYTTAATNQVTVFSGTASQHSTILNLPATAAARTYTFPDVSGTLVLNTLADGGTGKALTASNGGIVYTDDDSMEILAGTATANKMLLSGSSTTPTWSTATIPSTAGALNTRLKSDGTNYVASTTTLPDTGTSGKLIRGDGTNYVESTSTFANTYSASSLLYSNGANTVTGLNTGNNGILATDGSGVPSITASLPSAVVANITSLPGVTKPTVQEFTTGTAATYTTPAGAAWIRIKCWGGGGGSGGVAATGATDGAASGGGGGGGYVEHIIASPAATYTYTIGAAGAAGASGNNNGGNGGTTTWSGGGLVAAGGNGGSGCPASVNIITVDGGQGGAVAGGNITNTRGGSGVYGISVSNATGAQQGGYGGPSGINPGVKGEGVGAGLTPDSPGQGGYGRANDASDSAQAGVAGFRGHIQVEEFYV